MKKLFLALALVVGVVLVAPNAQAFYCRVPSFPLVAPRAPQKPREPVCVTLKNCTQVDVDIYKRQLENWVEDLKRYVRQAQEVADEYMEDVVKFAKCELSQ